MTTNPISTDLPASIYKLPQDGDATAGADMPHATAGDLVARGAIAGFSPVELEDASSQGLPAPDQHVIGRFTQEVAEQRIESSVDNGFEQNRPPVLVADQINEIRSLVDSGEQRAVVAAMVSVGLDKRSISRVTRSMTKDEIVSRFLTSEDPSQAPSLTSTVAEAGDAAITGMLTDIPGAVGAGISAAGRFVGSETVENIGQAIVPGKSTFSMQDRAAVLRAMENDLSVTDDEYSAELTNYFTDARDRGLLTNDSRMYLQTAIDLIDFGTDSSAAKTEKIFAALELPLAVVGNVGVANSAASSAARAARKVVTGGVRIAKAPEEALAAAGSVRRVSDVDNVIAALPDETVSEILTTLKTSVDEQAPLTESNLVNVFANSSAASRQAVMKAVDNLKFDATLGDTSSVADALKAVESELTRNTASRQAADSAINLGEQGVKDYIDTITNSAARESGVRSITSVDAFDLISDAIPEVAQANYRAQIEALDVLINRIPGRLGDEISPDLIAYARREKGRLMSGAVEPKVDSLAVRNPLDVDSATMAIAALAGRIDPVAAAARQVAGVEHMVARAKRAAGGPILDDFVRSNPASTRALSVNTPGFVRGSDTVQPFIFKVSKETSAISDIKALVKDADAAGFRFTEDGLVDAAGRLTNVSGHFSYEGGIAGLARGIRSSEVLVDAQRIGITKTPTVNDSLRQASYLSKIRGKISSSNEVSVVDIVVANPTEVALRGTTNEVVIVLGKADSAPFSTVSSASNIAERSGGRVITADGNFYVEVRRPLATTAEDGELADILLGVSGKPGTELSSVQAAFGKDVASAAYAGEDVITGVVQSARLKWEEAVKAASREDVLRVEGLVRAFRDNPRLNVFKQYIPIDQFRDVFQKTFGIQMSPSATDLYRTWAETDAAMYSVSAMTSLRRMKSAGAQAHVINNQRVITAPIRVTPGESLTLAISKTDPTFAEKAVIYDAQLKKYISADRVTTPVYRVKDDMLEDAAGGSVRYVTGEFTPTDITIFDAQAYNFGSHRAYSNKSRMRFMVTQSRTKKLGSGQITTAGTRTLFAAPTERAARDAAASFNNIASAYRRLAGGARGVIPDESIDEINAVILANNRFNRSIENVDDFMRFTAEQGVNPGDLVSVRGSGETLVEQSVFDASGATYLDALQGQGGRSSRVLLDDTGAVLDTESPFDSLLPSVNSTTQQIVKQSRFHEQASRLLSSVKTQNLSTNINNIQDLPLIDQLREMKINTSSVEGRRADNLRKYLVSNSGEAFGNTFMQGVADFMSNNIFLRGSERGALRRVNDTLHGITANPGGSLQSFNFHIAMGLLNPRQLYMQAWQAFSSAAVSSSNIGTANAVRAVISTPILSGAMFRGVKSDAETFSKSMRVFSKVSSLSEAESRNLVQAISDVGLLDVLGTGTDVGVGARKFSSLLDKSSVFYTTGSKIDRLSSAVLSALEMRQKYGANVDITDIAIRDDWAMRTRVFSGGMTRANRAEFQRGQLGFLFQYKTWFRNTLEALSTDKIWTREERARFAAAQLLMYGGVAVPGGGMLADIVFGNSTEPDSTVEELVRQGVTDTLAEALTGVDTRIGNDQAFTQGLFSMFATQDVASVLNVPGPSTAIRAIGQAARVVDAAVSTGSPTVTSNEFYKFLRTPSSINNALHAMTIWKDGGLYDKTGTKLSYSTKGKADAIAKLLGIPTGNDVNLRKSFEDLSKLSSDRSKWGEWTGQVMLELRSAVESGDDDEINRLKGELDTLIKSAPVSVDPLGQLARLNSTNVLVDNARKAYNSGNADLRDRYMDQIKPVMEQ